MTRVGKEFKTTKSSPSCTNCAALLSLPVIPIFLIADCHQRYCLVYMDVNKYEAALFARRVLWHPELDTQAKRMGAVIRVSNRGLLLYRLHTGELTSLDWPK